jgi:hypothetical protein
MYSEIGIEDSLWNPGRSPDDSKSRNSLTLFHTLYATLSRRFIYSISDTQKVKAKTAMSIYGFTMSAMEFFCGFNIAIVIVMDN